MAHDEDDDFYSNDDGDAGEGGIDLGQWIEECYVGDARFDTVELAIPGAVEGEQFRVRLVVNASAHFFVTVIPDQSVIRVGLALDDQELSEAIEASIEEHGGSMTEFLEEAMGSGGELENEMVHFHDDAFYFAADIPYDGDEQLNSQALRDEIVYYLDGHIDALMEYLEPAG